MINIESSLAALQGTLKALFRESRGDGGPSSARAVVELPRGMVALKPEKSDYIYNTQNLVSADLMNTLNIPVLFKI